MSCGDLGNYRLGVPMLNDLISTGNMMVGRMISGVVALSLDHPFALACILAALTGATLAVLLDVVGGWTGAAPTVDERPIRIHRR